MKWVKWFSSIIHEQGSEIFLVYVSFHILTSSEENDLRLFSWFILTGRLQFVFSSSNTTAVPIKSKSPTDPIVAHSAQSKPA